VHLSSHLRLYDIFGESGNRKVREKLERVSAPANKALDDLQAYDAEERVDAGHQYSKEPLSAQNQVTRNIEYTRRLDAICGQ
jgi:hypothetical protein